MAQAQHSTRGTQKTNKKLLLGPQDYKQLSGWQTPERGFFIPGDLFTFLKQRFSDSAMDGRDFFSPRYFFL